MTSPGRIVIVVLLLLAWVALVPKACAQVMLPHRHSVPYLSGHTINVATSDGNVCLEHTNSLTGVADSKTFTVSFWINYAQTNTSPYIFDISNGSGSHRFAINMQTQNKIQVFGTTATPTIILDSTSSLTISTGIWHHVYITMNMASTTDRHIYVDGVDDGSVTYTTYANNTLDLQPAAGAEWLFDGWNCSQKLKASLAEFWFNNSYLNTPTAFRDGTKPAWLGVNGEIPTGAAPILYLSQAGSGNTWVADSSGNGNDFVVKSGSLSSGSPP